MASHVRQLGENGDDDRGERDPRHAQRHTDHDVGNGRLGQTVGQGCLNTVPPPVGW